MSRLASRVNRLEGGHGEGVVVWAQAPNDWPEDRRKAAAAQAARQHGIDRPDRITLFPCGASECEGVQLLFVGTPAEADALGRKILAQLESASMKPRDSDFGREGRE